MLSEPKAGSPRYKFYYLHRSAVKYDRDGNAIDIVRGIPAITVCVIKDNYGKFFRGVSVASESEKSVVKKTGRYKAYGRMLKAIVHGKSGPDISMGGASDQIEKVLMEGPEVDNPNKYDICALLRYWDADTQPTGFEQKLFENEK